MPVNMRPLQPDRPMENPWLLPNLMPRSEVVFVDGASGVGKSMFLASFASKFSGVPGRDSAFRILYISSPEQIEERDHHLRVQDANLGLIVEAPFDTDHLSFELRPSIPMLLLNHIHEQIRAQPTIFVVIDDLEELLSLCPAMDETMMVHFWKELRAIARAYCTTFIIPRRHGLHECRSYGVYTRTGNDIIRYVLTMHFHTFDPKQRIFNVAKNKKGGIADQWQLIFEEDGKAFVKRAEAFEVLKPSKSPQPWHPNVSEAREDKEVLLILAEKMQGKPTTKEDMLSFAEEKGISRQRCLATLTRAKLHTTFMEKQHYYLPNHFMLAPFEEQLVREASRKKVEQIGAATPAHTPPAPSLAA